MTSHPRFQHSRTALAHAVSPTAWRSSFAMRPADASFAPAMKVGIAASLVLVSFGLAGQEQLAGIASLGALTSAFGRYQPYRRLAPMLAIVAGALLAAVAVGGLLGAAGVPMAAQIAVLSAVAGLAAHLFSAFRITGPGAVILVFAAAAGSGYAHSFDAIARALAAMSIGAAAGWVVAMAPVLIAPRGPARLAAAQGGSSAREALDRPAAPGFWAAARAGLASRESVHQALRMVVASALSGWAAVALGLAHPLWASMGAVAVLQGLNYGHTVQRGIQRVVGNVAGAVVAMALLSMSLGFWPSVALVVVFQVAAELLVLKNYALTTIAVTPMALIMTGLGSHLGPEAAFSRVADTLLGVVVGVLVAAASISPADRHHLLAGR